LRHQLSEKASTLKRQAVTKKPPSRAVRFVALVIVPLVVTVALLLLAEGTVRLRQWMKFGTIDSLADLYRTDDRIGLRVLKSGVKIGKVSINSAGFRGPEIKQPKPAGTLRLAFLGASTTFCAEVSSDAAVWPQLVVEILRDRFPEANFDFVNGGVPGYTVASSRRNLRHRVAALQPDIVVVYHATNDLSGEVNGLARQAGFMGPKSDAGPGWLERNSLLWELAVKNIRVMSAIRASRTGSGRLRIDAEVLGANFRSELGLLLREASSTGARVAVASFSTQLRASQTPEQQERAAVSALVYMPFMSLDGLLAGYARYNQIIGEAARAEGALLIDGHDRIPGDSVHFVDSVHFTDEGSRAMANRVADALISDPAIGELIHRRHR
jgi:lysophospholipase L1-like esterase